MKMLIMLLVHIVRSDSEDDKDDILKEFAGTDIKIFFSAYSHYHIGVRTKGDRKDLPFLAINKYADLESYGVNDMAKINVNGNGYEITLGTDMLCTSKNKNVVKCGTDDTDTTWSILPASFGYTIQKNKKCLTKSQTEALTLKKCTGDDDQKFDFKKFLGMDKCEEATKNNKDDDDSGKNINIKLVPPYYGYPDMHFLDHLAMHSAMHEPDAYSNVYGYADDLKYHNNDHLHDIPHIHFTDNEQANMSYAPQEFKVHDTSKTTIAKTTQPLKPIEIKQENEVKSSVQHKNKENKNYDITYRLFSPDDLINPNKNNSKNTQETNNIPEKTAQVISERKLQLFRA